MHIAYVDESGNIGHTSKNGTKTYTLGCLIVDCEQWVQTLDALVGFRRFLRQRFGVPFYAELKANFLLRGSGSLEKLGLPPAQRHAIYRQAMRLHPKLGFKTFAVVIDKTELEKRPEALNPRDVAWDYLLQRLRSGSVYAQPFGMTTFLIGHDEGESAVIQKLARKARRIGTAGSKFGTGSLNVPFTKLLEDPIPRNSKQSYFIQLADLAAYAAYRKLYPPPAHVQQPIVPATMWDQIGTAAYTQVTGGNTFAIVHWPT